MTTDESDPFDLIPRSGSARKGTAGMIFYAKRKPMVGTECRDDGHIYPDCVGAMGRKALDWLSANAKTEGLFDIFEWQGSAGEEPPRWDIDNIIWEHSETPTRWTCLHVLQAT